MLQLFELLRLGVAPHRNDDPGHRRDQTPWLFFDFAYPSGRRGADDVEPGGLAILAAQVVHQATVDQVYPVVDLVGIGVVIIPKSPSPAGFGLHDHYYK